MQADIVNFESENHTTLTAATSKWRPLGILAETSWLCPAASLLKHGRSAHRLLVNPISLLSWYSFLFFLCIPSILPSICPHNLHAFACHLVPLTSHVLSSFKNWLRLWSSPRVLFFSYTSCCCWLPPRLSFLVPLLFHYPASFPILFIL